MPGQPGLFDRDERYAALAAAGDPLERLAAVVDLELFRDELDAVLDRSDRTRGGHRCAATWLPQPTRYPAPTLQQRPPTHSIQCSLRPALKTGSSRCPVDFGKVGLGSNLAVPLTSGGGLLSGAKLKREDQEVTLGLEGRLAPGKKRYSGVTSNSRV